MEAYRDQYATLFNNGRNVTVIGISVDPDTALASWARDEDFPVVFASDPGGTVGKMYGAFDEKPASAVPSEVWDRWRGDPTFVPDGGESLVALGVRVRAACNELAPDAAERDVVVVSHVSPIKAAVAWALDVGDSIAWRLYVQDASVCRIAIGGSGPVVVTVNERHPPPA